MRGVQDPGKFLGKHQGAPFPVRWWWWVASSPRRWLRFGAVRRACWVGSSVLYRWMRRAPPSGELIRDALAAAVLHGSSSARLSALATVLAASLGSVAVESSASRASPSPVQEEAPEASGDDAAASPHNDVLAAAVLNGSSPAHLPALGANLAASLAGVESSASTPSPPLLQEVAPESSDHGTAASTRSDLLATAVINASSPAPLPALGDNLAASLAGVESSASTTSPSPLQEGASEASEHSAAASPHSDVLAAAVLNASSPCHLQEGPEASGHGVAASLHKAPASSSPPDSCIGAIICLEEEDEVEKEEEEVAVVVEQFVISLSGHGVAASQHMAPISPSLPDSCDGAIICLEEEEEVEEVVVVVEQEEEELQEEEEDDDPDKKTYAIYLSHVAETPKNSIVCLMCFLEDGEPKPILKSLIEKHCKSRHNTSGIKCEKTGCMVRAKYKGDIGKHNKYCHDLKPGWWKKPPRPDGA